MVFGIHSYLRVISHHARSSGNGRHESCIEIGPGYLAVRLCFEPFFGATEFTHLLAQPCNPVCQPHCLGLKLNRLRAVSGLKCIQVTMDALFNLL